jgi:hypothetical protein
MTGGQLADDLAIVNETVLWRRISPEWYVPDKNTGAYRITSQAFQNYPGTLNMSVCIAHECVSTDDLLTGHNGYGVAALTAGRCRDCDQGVIRHPVEHPAHCHVVGDKRKKKKCLQKGATIVVEPALG